jgi:hypothetical protein
VTGGASPTRLAGGLVFDPIPELTAMAMALRAARFDDAALADALHALEARTRATKGSDGAAWAAIYRDALSLPPLALAAQARLEAAKAEGARAQEVARRAQAASLDADAALQKALSDWPSRLEQQEADLLEKVAKSAEHVGVVEAANETTGETLYAAETTSLEGFFGWLEQARERWASQNAALLAQRAAEALEPVLRGLPAGLAPVLDAAPLSLRPVSRPRLKGYTVPTPGRFEGVAKTLKSISTMSATVAGFGYIVVRIAGTQSAVAGYLQGFFAVAFVVSIVVSLATVPKQLRQAKARLVAKATEAVRREVAEAARGLVKASAEAQLAAIRRHLGAEAQRVKRALREAAGPAQVGGIVGPAGLSPESVAKLGREWPAAIEGRLRAIEGA